MTTAYVDPQTIHNPAAGGKPPATWGDQVRDDLEFLIAPPMVKAQRSATQSISNSSLTAVQFNAADAWDTDAFHDTTTNNSRITIPTGFGGRYQIQANVNWDSNTSGVREVLIRFNGTTTIADVVVAGTCRQYVAAEYALSAGQYVEVVVWQDSGGARDIGGGNGCWFSARWISR
jgi:hypothetical protein